MQFKFKSHPPPPDELFSETFKARWIREWRERILGAPFLIADGIASVIAGSTGGLVIGLTVFVGLILVAGLLSAFVTPVFQRNEARQFAAPPDLPELRVELGIEHSATPVVDPTGAYSAAIFEFAIRNDEPEDVPPGRGTVIFEVPLECELRRVKQNGQGEVERGDFMRSDTRHWWIGTNANPILGAGGSTVSFYEVRFPGPGNYQIEGKLHVSGYAWDAVSYAWVLPEGNPVADVPPSY